MFSFFSFCSVSVNLKQEPAQTTPPPTGGGAYGDERVPSRDERAPYGSERPLYV